MSSTTTVGSLWPHGPLSSLARPTWCAPCTKRLRPRGYPQRFLTDDGRVFTTPPGHTLGAMELELFTLGITTSHPRPYHPQTWGKVERFHQSLKKYVAEREPASTKKLLQGQLNRFVATDNEVRPHRSLAGRTPLEAWRALEKAGLSAPASTRLAIGSATTRWTVGVR